MMDLVNMDDERRLWRYGYVDGHDGLIHRVNAQGFSICGMGRAIRHCYVEHGPTTCFRCWADRGWCVF